MQSPAAILTSSATERAFILVLRRFPGYEGGRTVVTANVGVAGINKQEGDRWPTESVLAGWAAGKVTRSSTGWRSIEARSGGA
jgi:hypothetical protein